MIYIWNFHVLSHLLLIYICKLQGNPGDFWWIKKVQKDNADADTDAGITQEGNQVEEEEEENRNKQESHRLKPGVSQRDSSHDGSDDEYDIVDSLEITAGKVFGQFFRIMCRFFANELIILGLVKISKHSEEDDVDDEYDDDDDDEEHEQFDEDDEEDDDDNDEDEDDNEDDEDYDDDDEEENEQENEEETDDGFEVLCEKLDEEDEVDGDKGSFNGLRLHANGPLSRSSTRRWAQRIHYVDIFTSTAPT